jgi:hypothetical protein
VDTLATTAIATTYGIMSSSEGEMLTFSRLNLVEMELARPNSRAAAAACTGRHDPRMTAPSAT